MRLQKHQLHFLFFFSVSTLTFGFWLFANWPGTYSWDVLSAVSSAKDGSFSNWGSYLYAALAYFIYLLSPNLFLLGVIQALLASFITSFCFAQLIKFNVKPIYSYLFFSLLVFNPVSCDWIVHYNRDILFGWLNLGLALLIFFSYCDSKYLNELPSYFKLFALSILTVLVSILRQDSLPLLFIVPVVFWQLTRFKIKKKLFALSSLTVFSFLLYIFIPAFLNIPLVVDHYKIASTINPLSYILVHGGNKSLTPRQVQAIDKVISVEALIKQHAPYEIEAFHNKENFRPYKKEDLKNYMKNFYEIIYNNPLLFLKNRTQLFIASIGLGSHTIGAYDLMDFKGDKSKLKPSDPRHEFSFAKPQLNRWPFKLAAELKKRFKKLTSFWGSSMLIQLDLCLLALIFFRVSPALSVASLIILFRLPIVFLASPGAYFKYLYSVYLFGFFVIPLFLMELRYRRMSG